ncbi:DUF488 domain-containing protein [Roseburia hominis]|uniref:DUF488 domain-containing protein n=1 Tax=Roseburia hominis TaxID=301301 RepID=UPI001F337C32|nr:DUF488 domain-containing protein [Roseburia hominis]
MENLFTIGHSQHTIDYFVYLLNKYSINYVLDVRSTPYSKYAEQFNKGNISVFLNKVNIHYFFMGKYFGARPIETSLYSEKGYLDFEKVAQSERFNKGMENVILGLERGNRIALMCTEKDPMDCHRAIMVSRAFDKKGIKVKHILPNGDIQTQRQLDNKLADKYFPNRGQLSIFNYENIMSEEEYISQAYRKRNEEIGYRIEQKEILAI